MDSIRRKLVDRFMASSDTNMGDVASGDSVLNSSYSESTLRQYWMPDAVSSDCYDCASTFTTFRRKHHCRICGQIFCSKCCGIFISGKYLKVSGSLRVCNKCHKMFEENMHQEQYLGETLGVPGSSGSSSPRIPQTEDRLSQRFSQLVTKSGSESDLSKNTETRRRSSYAGYITNAFLNSESCDNIHIEPSQNVDMQRLLVIWQKMSDHNSKIISGVHRYKMRSYVDVFLGEDLITWLYEHENLTVRKEAVDLAQALLDGELIEDVTNSFLGINDGLGGPRFQPSIPYKLKERRKGIPEESTEEIDPDWFQNTEISNEYSKRDQDLDKKLVHHDLPDSMSSPVDMDAFLRDSSAAIMNASDIPCPALDEVYLRHQEIYLDQLISAEKLSSAKWKEFIWKNCDQILKQVDLVPEVISSSKTIMMDIRDLVKIKCISKGDQQESCIIKGEVFTNNVIRSSMPSFLDNANVLLVSDSISYHREDRFESIANLHLVEEEFVKNICNKVKALKPDLILVGHNVCRLAQDILSGAGICVIQNVKEKNLKRISRLFNTPLLTSLESLINIPQLGTCEKYQSKYYEHQAKNLIFLEGSHYNHWGCCIVLRGGSLKELVKVKRIMKQLMLVKTHARFEKAFLMDESAQVDNFILPDHRFNHLLSFSLSPFVQLPLPEDAMLKDLENELKDSAHEDLNDYNSNDETDDAGQGKHEPVNVKPLVLKTHMRNDVSIRNMLADMRCAPIRPRRVDRPKKIYIPPAPTFYKILNKPMPMSFSSYLSNPGGGGSRYCVKPWVSNLKQYQNTDVPLGIFLQDYCFDTNFRHLISSNQEVKDQDIGGISNITSNASSSSSSNNKSSTSAATHCQIPMGDHGRRFCLANTSISLIVQTLNNSITKEEGQIVMWKYCSECTTMTELMPLSPNAWKMSFAMFLLILTFESKMVRRKVIKCDHSLHNSQITCFGSGDQVAFFKLQHIIPHEIRLPQERIDMVEQFPYESELRDDLSRLSVHGSGVFGQLNAKLIQLQNECSSSNAVQTLVNDLLKDEEIDSNAYRESLAAINDKLNEEEFKDLARARSDTLMLKIFVVQIIFKWKLRFNHFFDVKRKEDKASAKAKQRSGTAQEATEKLSSSPGGNERKESKEKSTPSLNSGLTEQEFGSLENPFPGTLHPDLFLKPHILVDESQPSTIIAYALGSSEHLEFLEINEDASKRHLDIQFGDEIEKNESKFKVSVHFATEFDKFRKEVFEGDLNDFIASLSGCDPWQTSGGKSGATFFKTFDGRFLIKEVNKHEMETFKNIAKRYFEYIVNGKGKTSMAKIVGLYTLWYKTANSAKKLNVIIMENLFYKHRITGSFDLKGSMRNRLVDPSGNKMQGKELVLMDENFLRMACEKPFYVRQNTKSALIKAVQDDAKFLCEIKVMDYSLLVGKNEITHELVVGIIDYLRPFSIDKMIESQVKKGAGYFQGTAEDPTVISPQAYQNRFIVAMNDYFVLLPHYWYESPPLAKSANEEKQQSNSFSRGSPMKNDK